MTVFSAAVTRASLDRAMQHVAPHLRSLLVAVRDHGLGFMFVPQAADPFRIPKRSSRPAIVLIGDDFDVARGPDAFHMPSIRRIIRSCDSFAVVSSEPAVELYATMAAAASLTRRSSMIIETRPEQEIQWVHLIRKLAPGRPICLATVKGGNA